MVFTVNDLSTWDNFPKGLKVLLLLNGGEDDGNGFSASETRSKLESMDYIVTTFTDESEALTAVFKNTESFHIAIVEVKINAEKEISFKFLEAAKDFLPTIMISTDHCITTSMKCIALGAVEFLEKPLSPEKLKNIWQHVVHKVFKHGGSNVSGYCLKPVRESIAGDNDEKDPAPLTPQLRQDSRLLNGDCHENMNCSMDNVNSSTEKENMEDHQDIGESKSVDTTNRESEDDKVVVKEERGGESEKEEEEGESGSSDKTDYDNYCHMREDDTKPINKTSGIISLSCNKTNRKKVDWTQELHKKFVQAVEQLGIDQAIPSRILELMKVEGLTRHNVASHLQKFRKHRRNILPKENYNHRSKQIQRSYNGFQQHNRPVMAYPVWGLPGVHPPAAVPPLWPPPLQTAGQTPPWHWKPPYPTVNGRAWGCPVGPPLTGTYNTPPNVGGFQYFNGAETGFKIMPATQPDEEMIDQVVKEAISKPWMPLPLGLKPPSAESVLAELSRQGISAVPSSSPSCLINGSHCLR